jgi:tRNA modification GTPase
VTADGGQDVDTIAAVATAPGQAGIGVIRVSGPDARAIGEQVGGDGLQPRRVQFRSFRDGEGEVLDTGLVLYFAAPKSFTGEDVVEFQGHGGPVVLQMLLDEILQAGARIARPGEFTERAYLNGKLDLTQAEAVADLIAGSSEAAVRGANRSLSGAFSERVGEIDARVVALRVFVEAAIDFPDEDVDLLAEGQIEAQVTEIIDALSRLESDCAQGVILRDGIKLALVGAPNVGKSSLLNRLTGESRAIVTDIPGTTRDLVRADLNLGGLPVEVVDTAGLRQASDAVEAEGVKRALAEASSADIVLVITAVDSLTEQSFEETVAPEVPDLTAIAEVLSDTSEQNQPVDSERIILVLNKIDLSADSELTGRAHDAGYQPVSAETGEGVDALREAIRVKAGFTTRSNLFTARKRHLLALKEALLRAESARSLAADTLPGELVAEELRAVHRSLGEIVGEMSSDALLGEIFANFCIGK